MRQRSSKAGWTNYLFVCALAIIIMIVDARTTWLAGVRNQLNVLTSPIQSFAALPSVLRSRVEGLFSSETDIKIEHENLRNEYFKLKAEALLQVSLEQENEELRALLQASERLSERVELVALINVDVDRSSHKVLINKGYRSGVYVGQAVIDDQGVIGQVTEVMPTRSSVTLITDPGHAMPVQLQRSGLRTLVYGTGNVTIVGVPFLNQNFDIEEGDIMLSSGLGGRFPAAYPVAVVTKVEESGDEAFIRVSARPIAKLDRSNYVLLLKRDAINPADRSSSNFSGDDDG